MKVTITYYDTDSLTREEVVRQAKHNYGEHAQVEIMPTSDDPKDLIYFALQQLVTYEQLSSYFDAPHTYKESMSELHARMLSIANQEIYNVLLDNEKKVS
jgi:hypothetical protein